MARRQDGEQPDGRRAAGVDAGGLPAYAPPFLDHSAPSGEGACPPGAHCDSGTLMRVCMPHLCLFLIQILGCPSTRGSRTMYSNADHSRSLCASGMRYARLHHMDNVAAAWRHEAARRGGLTGCAGGVAGGADVVSVSEFDSDADLAERHAAVAGAAAAARRPGLVERQDSANYQPRPPAMTERQDSAQNLQARTTRVRPLRVLARVTHVDSVPSPLLACPSQTTSPRR